jgi:serine/threonine protein kinase
MTSLQLTGTPVDELACDFVQRCRRGERPTIGEYLERRPDLADTIRDLFPGLVMLECAASDEGQHPRHSLLSRARQPDVLGDYRVLREVGRGGMGIVYEAEQISLGRRVALKVLPFQMASDECAVARFRREARIAARLQHPHIVTVYDSGQQDEVCYYAMQFIHGQSLQAVMADLQLAREGSLDREPASAASLASALLSGTLTWSVELLPENVAEPLKDRADEASGSGRSELIHQIVDDYVLRRSRGECVSDESIIAQYPHLAPQLTEELQMLQLIEASRLPSVVDDLMALGEKLSCQRESRERVIVEELDAEGFEADNCCDHCARLPAPPHSSWVRSSREYFESVAHLGLQAADALAHAHELGVIHRDVKPSNLLLDAHGHLWVTDFGTAKSQRPDASSTNRFVGTLRYMAPEQIKGHSAEVSDVYSLGVTLYELLVLRPAFEATDYLNMIQQICHSGPLPPRRLDPNIPGDLETIIMTAIQRDPGDRYPSARALADDLRRFLTHRPVTARRSFRATRLWAWLRQSRVVALVIASLISSLLTATILLTLRNGF